MAWKTRFPPAKRIFRGFFASFRKCKSINPAIGRNLTNHLRLIQKKTVNKGDTVYQDVQHLVNGITYQPQFSGRISEPSTLVPRFAIKSQRMDITKIPRLQLVRCLAQGQGICGDGGNEWCLKNRKYIEKVDPRNRNHYLVQFIMIFGIYLIC